MWGWQGARACACSAREEPAHVPAAAAGAGAAARRRRAKAERARRACRLLPTLSSRFFCIVASRRASSSCFSRACGEGRGRGRARDADVAHDATGGGGRVGDAMLATHAAPQRGGAAAAAAPCAWPSCRACWPGGRAPRTASPSRPRPCLQHSGRSARGMSSGWGRGACWPGSAAACAAAGAPMGSGRAGLDSGLGSISPGRSRRGSSARSYASLPAAWSLQAGAGDGRGGRAAASVPRAALECHAILARPARCTPSGAAQPSPCDICPAPSAHSSFS